MIKEHDRVVLKSDMPASALQAGDVGTVVHIYADGNAYELEFVGLDGATLAIVTADAAAVRPVNPREIPHARQLAAS